MRAQLEGSEEFKLEQHNSYWYVTSSKAEWCKILPAHEAKTPIHHGVSVWYRRGHARGDSVHGTATTTPFYHEGVWCIRVSTCDAPVPLFRVRTAP